MGTLDPDFSDDVVVVTGGSSGIGREVALQFGRAGATVLVGDVDPDPKDPDADTPTAEVIEADGGEGAFVETDVSDPADCETLVATAREFGGVDVMVNNAGIFREGDALGIEAAALDAMFAVNVRGVVFGTRVAAADMIEREDPGAVVNTASISSTMAQFDQVGYDASKGAVMMATRGAALDLAEHGIRVNAVAPGQIGTEIIEGWSESAQEETERGDLIKPVPLGRAGTPADVAPAYLYLASEDADYVTGALLHVDGGWQVF